MVFLLFIMHVLMQTTSNGPNLEPEWKPDIFIQIWVFDDEWHTAND